MNMRGTVARFDAARGVGEITGADGASYAFHSTVIAGGTRTIETGTEVEFAVVPGHRGRWEAAEVTPA